MRMHTCVDDKVCLVFEGTLVARNAITSRDLMWVREQAALRSVAPLSTMNLRFLGLDVRQNNGVIMARVACHIVGVAVAREVARYQGAVRMIMDHERKHIQEWDEAMGPFFEGWAALLEERIRPPERPYVVLVHNILTRELPRLRDCVNRSTIAWDRRDWPMLHRALQRTGVPPEFSTTSGNVEIVLGEEAGAGAQGAAAGARAGR